MSIIAGIIYNRLEQGMPLQMDSTREYINDYVTGNPLLGDTSKYAELYNTYKCAALPAGPICSPGADAISAAKNPTQTEYLYFFFGKHHISAWITIKREISVSIRVCMYKCKRCVMFFINTGNLLNDKKMPLGIFFVLQKTWNVSQAQGIYLKGIKIRKGVLQWPYQI